jgi:hypothetical protein
MNQMGERKIGSSGCSQGTYKGFKSLKTNRWRCGICQLKVGQVLIKGIKRRITIGNDLFCN